MYQYFAINIILSVLVLVYLNLLKTAPFRIRFRLVMIGLISWLLPYELIYDYFMQGQAYIISTTVSDFNGAIKNAIISQVNSYTFLSIWNIILALTLIGLILFLKDVFSLKKYIKQLNLRSCLYKKYSKIEIYSVSDRDCIFSTGLINPKIYISEKHIDSKYFESIVKHEVQHIQTNDQMWLLLITFIQKLFWWNPMVSLLAQKARDFLELSCDQACNEKIENNKYQIDLAELLIQSNQKSNPLTSHFFGKQKLNIYRIKQLSKEFKMNNKNKSIIYTTAIIPLIILLLVSKTSTSEPLSTNENVTKKESTPIVLANDEVDMTIKAILTINTEWDKNIGDISGETTFSDTKSIESRMISKFDQKLKLKSSLELELTPKKVNDDQVFIETEITYFIDGKKITQRPSMLVANNNESSLVIDGKNHTFELKVLPRF